MAAKKTLFHSELVKLGPVAVTVESDVMKSKFSKPGAVKPDYVVLIIDGEERTYNTENAECAAFFDGQKGRTFTLVAEGSRENATLTYVGEAMPAPAPEAAKPPVKAPSRPGKPATPPAAPATQRPAAAAAPDGLKAGKLFIARNESLAKVALQRLRVLNAAFNEAEGVPMPQELLAAVYNTLVFGATAAGIPLHMPANLDFATLQVPQAKEAA